MIKVLIAEDQAMMRGALAVLLDLEDDLEVVAQVATADAILSAALEREPDVALLDIELPGGNGIDAARDLRAALPGCAVVIVTTFGRPGYLQRAMAAGGLDPSRTGRRDRRGPALATAALTAGPNPLTDREKDVLKVASDGSTVADIAVRAHLSESTVRNYLSSAIGKTGTRNRMEAVLVARGNGWL